MQFLDAWQGQLSGVQITAENTPSGGDLQRETASIARRPAARYRETSGAIAGPRSPMLKPKPLDVAAIGAKLDDALFRVQREAEGAEADPFDEAMMAAVIGAADAMKAQSDELEVVRRHMTRMTRN